MGACFVTMSLPGALSRDQVEKAFREAQEQDRYDNGHSYSGGIGMANGLQFDGRDFPDARSADAYLGDACVKWEEARAVKYKTHDGSEKWLIGAVCSS